MPEKRILADEHISKTVVKRLKSFGKARQLAEMTKEEFHRELGVRGIERHYTEEELEEDISYGKE